MALLLSCIFTPPWFSTGLPAHPVPADIPHTPPPPTTPIMESPLHLSTLLFLPVPAGAEAASLQGPLATDRHAPLLRRPVGHPEQSLPTMSDGASPGGLLTGPVHGPLRCSCQAAVCHRLDLSAPSK